ncbi:helix-turn-helix domain-containing protein [Patescibacteria group bacterium]|nr:MAG: helix-turn-helix domain-containing protein [Patescibacteria group bacterium]
MSGFRKKKIKLPDTLGECLKKCRYNKGVSLALAERELKVRKDYLMLLEKGEFDKLPADVYTKGILKAYAAFLGLDYKKEILPLYRRERGIHMSVHGTKKPEMDVTTQLKSPRFVLTPKTIITLVVVVFVLGLGFYLWYQFSAFASAPELSLSQPEEGANLTTSLVTVVGKTNPGIELFINGQKIALSEDGSFKNQVSLQEGVNIVEVIARNKVGKETVIRRSMMVELPAIVSSKKSSSQKKTTGLEIVVKIRDGATWLSVEEDGKLVYEGTMLPGSSQTFEAKNSISISSGKGDNTLLEVNGEDWGVLEDTPGVVRDLVITKEMAERGR